MIWTVFFTLQDFRSHLTGSRWYVISWRHDNFPQRLPQNYGAGNNMQYRNEESTLSIMADPIPSWSDRVTTVWQTFFTVRASEGFYTTVLTNLLTWHVFTFTYEGNSLELKEYYSSSVQRIEDEDVHNVVCHLIVLLKQQL